MSGAKKGAELRLVTPGEVVEASPGTRAGIGTLSQNGNIIATRVGWAKEYNGVISIDPINASYMPRSGDLVIGIIESVRNNLWFADVKGPFNGLLPMSLAPWKVEFGAAREHMDIGDVMLARVQEVDEAHNIVLTMKGVGLRKIKEGVVSEIAVNNISKLRGENNSILNSIKEYTDCRIIVAENGRIWIDGDSENISTVKEIIDILNSDGHKDDFENSLSSIVGDIRRNA